MSPERRRATKIGTRLTSCPRGSHASTGYALVENQRDAVRGMRGMRGMFPTLRVEIGSCQFWRDQWETCPACPASPAAWLTRAKTVSSAPTDPARRCQPRPSFSRSPPVVGHASAPHFAVPRPHPPARGITRARPLAAAPGAYRTDRSRHGTGRRCRDVPACPASAPVPAHARGCADGPRHGARRPDVAGVGPHPAVPQTFRFGTHSRATEFRGVGPPLRETRFRDSGGARGPGSTPAREAPSPPAGSSPPAP